MITFIYIVLVFYIVLLASRHGALSSFPRLLLKVPKTPALQLLLLSPIVYWMGGGWLTGKQVMFVAYLFLFVGYLIGRIGGDKYGKS